MLSAPAGWGGAGAGLDPVKVATDKLKDERGGDKVGIREAAAQPLSTQRPVPHLCPILDLAGVGTPRLGGCDGPKATSLRVQSHLAKAQVWGTSCPWSLVNTEASWVTKKDPGLPGDHDGNHCAASGQSQRQPWTLHATLVPSTLICPTVSPPGPTVAAQPGYLGPYCCCSPAAGPERRASHQPRSCLLPMLALEAAGDRLQGKVPWGMSHPAAR